MISRRIFAAVAVLCVLVMPAHAQKTKAQLSTEIGTNFPDNTVGQITPQNLRTVTGDIVNSIMPTAPVVSGNLACFNGTTGLLQDCGTAPSSFTAANHAVAVGTGSFGFTSVAPGASGFPLVSNGASADPSYGVIASQALNFIQNGTGAVGVTFDQLHRGVIVTPEMFGDGVPCSSASSAGIQKAETYLESTSNGGTLQFANCTYNVSGPINVQGNGIRWNGYQQAPFNGTRILWTPGAASQCALNVTANPSSGILSNFTVENMTVTTSDTVTYKHGMCVNDGSVIAANNFSIRNFTGGNGGVAQSITGIASSGAANEVRLTVSNASTIFPGTLPAAAVAGVTGGTNSNDVNSSWPINVVDATHVDLKGSTFTAGLTGGTIQLSSTALRTKGRELYQFNNITLTGDIGLRISANPNVAGGIEAMDESTFNNMTIVGTGTNAITMIDDGTVMTSLNFTGTQSWGGGKNCLQWRDRSSAAINEQVRISNMRCEQTSVSGGWEYDIQPNNATYSLIIDNPLMSRTNGFRVRNTNNLTVNSAHWLSTGLCADLDASVANTQINGSYWFAGSTANLSGQTPRNASGPNPPTGCLPPTATYSNSTLGSDQLYTAKVNNTLTVVGSTTFGQNGGVNGTTVYNGLTSGSVTVVPQSVAGTPTITWPNTSGTVVTNATSPVAVNATTGNVSCATCVTSSGGGALTGTAPVTVSAAGNISLSPVTGSGSAVLATNPTFAGWTSSAQVQVSYSDASQYVGRFLNTHATAGDLGFFVAVGANAADSTSIVMNIFDGTASTQQGNIKRNGNGAVAYNTTSDQRLKTVVSEHSATGLADLMKISVPDYVREGSTTVEQGYLAQQLNSVYPIAVSKPDPNGPDDPHKNPWSVDYGRVTPLIISAMQEHVKRTDAELADLRACQASWRCRIFGK